MFPQPFRPRRGPPGARARITCLLSAALLPLLAGCGGETGSADGNAVDGTAADGTAAAASAAVAGPTVPLSRLSDPLQEIGEFEGGGNQTLDFVSGVTLLGDDRIAVVDQGSSVVLVYDGDGALVETFGGEGDGPGEFRSPTDIRVLPGDSIRILDSRDLNVSVLDPDREWVREFPAASPFAGRYLLQGSVTPDERDRALAILARRPYPSDRKGFRLAALAADGRMWVRERLGTSSEPSLWIVLDAEGTPIRAVETPERFRPMFMSGDVVLGRWRGEFDVHYAHRYDLEPTGESRALPDWLDAATATGPAPPMPDSVRRSFMSILRNLATEQEIYYSDHGSYTTAVDSLMRRWEDIETPETLGVDVLHATERGWSMILTMAGHGGMCAIRFGAGGPPTLRSGTVACGT